MDYAFHLLILWFIYGVLVLSVNLLIGYAGLLAAGQTAFFCIGAYASAILMTRAEWPFLPAITLSTITCGIVGMIVGWPAMRLRGDYFILSSLGLLALTNALANNWVGMTRGPYGIFNIPSLSLIIPCIPASVSALIVCCVVGLITMMTFVSIHRSHFARMLKATREDEAAVQVLGWNTHLLKLSAFAISACFAALAGGLYAAHMSYIDPTAFHIDQAVIVLSMVIIGGSGNVSGPLLGTMVIVLLPECLRLIDMPSTAAAAVRQIIYGLSIVLIMRFRPWGLVGEYRFK